MATGMRACAHGNRESSCRVVPSTTPICGLNPEAAAVPPFTKCRAAGSSGWKVNRNDHGPLPKGMWRGLRHLPDHDQGHDGSPAGGRIQ